MNDLVNHFHLAFNLHRIVEYWNWEWKQLIGNFRQPKKTHCILLLVPWCALNFTITFNQLKFYIGNCILVFFIIKITQAFKHALEFLSTAGFCQFSPFKMVPNSGILTCIRVHWKHCCPKTIN